MNYLQPSNIMVMKCPKCGKEITNDSVFCEICGIQISKRSKQIDIRWALLPAMLIATFTMFMGELITSSNKADLVGYAVCSIILPIMLFLITLWNRKNVPMSFILIMGVYLIICCLMFIFLINARLYAQEFHHDGVYLMFSDIVDPPHYSDFYYAGEKADSHLSMILIPLFMYIIYIKTALKKGWSF